MANDNRISSRLGDEDLAFLRDTVQSLRARLPFLLSLTVQERKELAKLGEKSIGFDEKCSTYMANNPEFLPGFVDLAEVEQDRALRSQVLRFFAELDRLHEQVDDTLMVLGNEILMADLAYYQSVREAARRGLPGAEAIYEDLRSRFPGAPRQARTEKAGQA